MEEEQKDHDMDGTVGMDDNGYSHGNADVSTEDEDDHEDNVKVKVEDQESHIPNKDAEWTFSGDEETLQIFSETCVKSSMFIIKLCEYFLVFNIIPLKPYYFINCVFHSGLIIGLYLFGLCVCPDHPFFKKNKELNKMAFELMISTFKLLNNYAEVDASAAQYCDIIKRIFRPLFDMLRKLDVGVKMTKDLDDALFTEKQEDNRSSDDGADANTDPNYYPSQVFPSVVPSSNSQSYQTDQQQEHQEQLQQFSFPIQYQQQQLLKFEMSQIPTAATTMDPSYSLDGLKRFEGWLTPNCSMDNNCESMTATGGDGNGTDQMIPGRVGFVDGCGTYEDGLIAPEFQPRNQVQPPGLGFPYINNISNPVEPNRRRVSEPQMTSINMSQNQLGFGFAHSAIPVPINANNPLNSNDRMNVDVNDGGYSTSPSSSFSALASQSNINNWGNTTGGEFEGGDDTGGHCNGGEGMDLLNNFLHCDDSGLIFDNGFS
ncbi:unnamed protein product [Ambrosiozyma monospora]|uniref:Unnamed protein product n=1 Tax=Ambrosiozyma monospora TaxID=43982 RepID=A0A9W6YVH4_AMBMO|nr:unnamed protein product [Ambrosiozyma monospora]